MQLSDKELSAKKSTPKPAATPDVRVHTPTFPIENPPLAGSPCDSNITEGLQYRATHRWWVAVACATVASLPVGWLLSYAASLPFGIGLFFFALFGLIIGAICHRIAAPGRPYSQTPILIGTTVIVLTCWMTSIIKESRDFPRDMAAKASTWTIVRDHPVAEFRQTVADSVRLAITSTYPPGGLLGYTRWVVSRGVFETGEIKGVKRPLGPGQTGVWWVIRVVLSIGLLAFGIASQTLALRLERDAVHRAIDMQD